MDRRKNDPMINPGGPKDPVTNPVHYTSTKISPIEVIEDWNLGFSAGNALKYVGRHKLKNGIEDLKKARWYLERSIRDLKAEIQSLIVSADDVVQDWSLNETLQVVVESMDIKPVLEHRLNLYKTALRYLNAEIRHMEIAE